jgi:hypothetical protein
MADENAKIDANSRNSLVGQDESTGESRRVQVDANGAIKVVIDSFTGTFLDLLDTPSSYTGQAGNVVTVNGTEDGLEFTAGGGGGDVTGPAGATSGNLASYDGATGKIIDDSGIAAADVYSAGGTDVAVADGGTGASTASGARTNLGLGTIATQAANNVAITGGSITGITDLAIADGGTGASSASAAFSNLKQDASTTSTGVVELTTAAEVTTGTDASRAITPDAFAGSDYGIRLVHLQLVAGGADVATGDGAGNARFFVPEEINGWNLVSVAAAVITAGTTGTTDIQIHNVTDAVDILSTKITIDSGEKTSYTAATAPVINTANDDVATGDELRFDVDAVSTTAPQGLIVILGFQLP